LLQHGSAARFADYRFAPTSLKRAALRLRAGTQTPASIARGRGWQSRGDRPRFELFVEATRIWAQKRGPC
jgi:hypothetical protein